MPGAAPVRFGVFFLREQPSRPYILREADAQACEFWGCVFYVVAKLDSPSNISDYYGNVYGIMQEMCHFSRGIIAQSLSMKTNSDILKHSEAHALIQTRPHLSDLMHLPQVQPTEADVAKHLKS